MPTKTLSLTKQRPTRAWQQADYAAQAARVVSTSFPKTPLTH